jgi:hypothetical protein
MRLALAGRGAQNTSQMECATPPSLQRNRSGSRASVDPFKGLYVGVMEFVECKTQMLGFPTLADGYRG